MEIPYEKLKQLHILPKNYHEKVNSSEALMNLDKR